MSLVLGTELLATGIGEPRPGWVVIDGDLVTEVGHGRSSTRGTVQVSGPIMPGLVDIHTHGGDGIDLSTASPAEARHLAELSWRRGVTSIVASLATAPVDALTRQIEVLAPLVHEGVLAGLHLEGPYLSPARRGAHDRTLLRDPDLDQLAGLLRAGTGSVRMVTIAPELPGALDVVRSLRRQGVTVALGHSDATADEARDAIAAGATVATHVFNGMPPLGHREPGLAGACLLDPGVVVELIADGSHVADDVLRLVASLAPGRIALVSDAMAAASLGPGRYSVAGSTVEVVGGIARTVDSGSLAGSTTTLDLAFDRFRQLDGIGFAGAVSAATSTPAAALRLPHGIGSLTPGGRADLVVDDGGERRTMRGGRWL